jgi:hypothetical protein
MKVQDLWISALNLVGQAWWVEITTESPHCVYYFGPFTSEAAALDARGGYVEDLEAEMARGIKTVVKRCKPESLTIDYEPSNNGDRFTNPLARSLSGQPS